MLTMNREEKIQQLAKLIHGQHKAQEPFRGYTVGDTIELFSVTIEFLAYIDLNNQAYALDILRDTYKCIRYSTIKGYSDKSELSPNAHNAIREMAEKTDLPLDLIEQGFIEETVVYKIEVLDTLEDAINILGGLLCELTVENGVTPTVTIQGKKYKFQPLLAGSATQRLVEYASKGCYDTELNGNDFKATHIAQLNTSSYNIIQIFKRNIFGKAGSLRDFAIITPKTFLLKKKVLLSEDTISDIKKMAQN